MEKQYKPGQLLLYTRYNKTQMVQFVRYAQFREDEQGRPYLVVDSLDNPPLLYVRQEFITER